MFITFLLPYIDRGQGPVFRWVMAAQLSKLGPKEVTVIADERYFSMPLNWEEDACSFGVSYRNLDSKQWQSVRKIALPDDVFKELETRSLSMLDAFRILLTRDYPPLTAALRAIFREICRETQPEAVLSWCNVPSLELVAAEFNLPVIHNELGPFRPPNYQGTAYFDFQGVNGKTSAADNMAAFVREVRNANGISLPGIDELRRILMIDPSRGWEQQPALFKSGAALQVEDDSNLLAFNHGMTNFELIFAARKGLDRRDLLIRRHPRGHLYYGEELGVPDDSIDSIQFISRCEKIFCINSSVAFEALLLEKPVHLFGDSPAACLTYERLARLSPQDLIACLNYIFIGYLVPISLLFDAQYYRWRLTYPSLEEIYRNHLRIFRRLAQHPVESYRSQIAVQPPSTYTASF